jgi:hypothetical protein
VAKYLGTSIKPNPKEDEKELEDLLDLLQPGWRQVVVKKRPLPSMVVSNTLVTAANGGLSGRADPKIEEKLYVVGDWVGPEGLLSNSSFASAKRAAQLIMNLLEVLEILAKNLRLLTPFLHKSHRDAAIQPRRSKVIVTDSVAEFR